MFNTKVIKFTSIAQANIWLRNNPRQWGCEKWTDGRGIIFFLIYEEE